MLQGKAPNIHFREISKLGRKCTITPINHPTSWISKVREASVCIQGPILFNLLPYQMNLRYQATQIIGMQNQVTFVIPDGGCSTE